METLGPDEFDAWYADMAASTRRDEIVAATLGLPAELQSSSLVPYSGIADILDVLRIGDGDVLADLACGRGGYGLEIARRTGCRLIGVDFSAVAVEQATHNAERFAVGERASFVVGSLEQTGLEAGSVDAVLCIDAIAFADPISDALVEMRRILRSGGRVAITGWEARDRSDERVSERQRRCDLARDLPGAGFVDVRVDERADWHAAERTLWQTAVATDPDGDAALESLREEAEHVLAQFDGSRRVFATATAP